MKYICIDKCFYNNRLWTPGESLETKDKKVPKHFKKAAEANKILKSKEKPVPEEPKTMKDLHNKEMESLLIGTPKDSDMFN